MCKYICRVHRRDCYFVFDWLNYSPLQRLIILWVQQDLLGFEEIFHGVLKSHIEGSIRDSQDSLRLTSI